MSAIQQMLGLSGGGVAPANDPTPSLVTLAIHGDSPITDKKLHTLSVTGSAASQTTNRPFATLGAIDFTGSPDGINIGGDVQNTDYNVGTGSFTVRAFVRPTGSGGAYQAIIDTRFNGSSSTGFFFGLDPSNRLIFYTGTAAFFQDSVALTRNGAFTQVQVNKDASSGKLYVFKGGVSLIPTGSSISSNFTDGRMFIGIGNSGGGGGSPWIGQIAELEVVKGQCLNTASFAPPTAPFSDTGL